MRRAAAIVMLYGCGGNAEVTADATPLRCADSMTAIPRATDTLAFTDVTGQWTFTGTYKFRSFEMATPASFVYAFEPADGPCVAGRLVMCTQSTANCVGVPTGDWYAESPSLAIRFAHGDMFDSTTTWVLGETASGAFTARGSTYYTFHSPETIQFYDGMFAR